MSETIVRATVSSPTNIAVIKYWGKRDAKQNVPINSSVSLTLNQRDLRTVTTVTASTTFDRDRLWLNGVEEDLTANKRMLTVLRETRARAGDLYDADGKCVVAQADWAQMCVRVVSANNFPTAAGLASSAAGYAALTYALAQLMAVKEAFPGELSTIARMGSGSACRSLHGGFVAWDMGVKEDCTDSRARQVAPHAHWPELQVRTAPSLSRLPARPAPRSASTTSPISAQVLILVVSDRKKTVSSTAGMGTSVATSPLLAHRATAVVPERCARTAHTPFRSRGDCPMRGIVTRCSGVDVATG